METGPVRAGTQRAGGDLVTGRWRVGVDATRCFGSGSCTGVAAGYFTMDGHVSRPTHELIDPDESVLDAAELCPAVAISVRDELTGETLAPQD